MLWSGGHPGGPEEQNEQTIGGNLLLTLIKVLASGLPIMSQKCFWCPGLDIDLVLYV